MGVWVVVALLLTVVSALQLSLFVDQTRGNDANFDGRSLETPFASISRAVEEVEALKALGVDVTISIANGTYLIRDSMTLDGAHSSKLKLTALPGHSPVISGGVFLNQISTWKVSHHPAIAARVNGLVLESRVPQEFLEVYVSKLDQERLVPSLYVGSHRMRHAMFPDSRFDSERLNFTRISRVTRNYGENGAYVLVELDQPFPFSVWKQNRESHVWLHGYFGFDWADEFLQLDNPSYWSNDGKSLIVPNDKVPEFGIREGGRIHAINVLSELDSEGEFFIDYDLGTIYFFPPKNIEGELVLSTADIPLLKISRSRGIQVSGLAFAYSSAQGIQIEQSSNIEVSQCHFVHMHGMGIVVKNSSNVRILKNRFEDLGVGAVSIACGDTLSLSPGSCLVESNTMTRFAQWKRTYSPAILWSGVGNDFRNNDIFDAPHTGILCDSSVSGQFNNFESNVLHNLAWETNDVGAWYCGASWITLGNRVRYNHFFNITNQIGKEDGVVVVGVYLDDELSGTLVEENYFDNVDVCVQLGGGRRNAIRKNLFLNFARFGILYDHRGEGWDSNRCATGGLFQKQLESVNYKDMPWSRHFPEWIHTFEEFPCVPIHNEIVENLYSFRKDRADAAKFIDASNDSISSWKSIIANNIKVPVESTK